MDDMEARTLVRRFTEELQGTTDLEVATQRAQVVQDNDATATEQSRIQKTLDLIDGNTNTAFGAAEAERLALERINQIFRHETKPVKTGRWGLNRKTAQDKATELLQDAMINSSDSLCNLVNNLNTSWQAQNGPAYKNWQRVCKTLHDHKSVFSIFPSQNVYTSVLCSSLSLIVQASVNHDAIPELLSKSVAEISEKVAICAQFVEIVEEKHLHERLADIYALLLKFYRDAMAWFLKSRVSRFMSSFNEELKDIYQQAVRDIEGRIDVLYRQADSVQFRIFKRMSRNIEDMKEESFRQRQIYNSDMEVGRKGLQLITETMLDMQKNMQMQSEIIQKYRMITGGAESPRDIQQEAITYLGKGKQITGQQFRTYTGAVRSVIVGEEGFKYLNQGYLWLVDGLTLAKLEVWMLEKPVARTLWISSPMSNAVSGARAAAISVLASSLQAEQPIISHFCRRPHRNEVSKQLTSEEAGILGLVYSLINQLQQFVRDEDWIEVDEETLRKLDGSRESWSTSLQLLAVLLRTTPNFPCCVIDGINELEWSGGVEWCREFLKIIQQEEQYQSYSLLITTTGQSRFLANLISPQDRYFVSSIPQQVRVYKPR